jgi:hypothetical protein
MGRHPRLVLAALAKALGELEEAFESYPAPPEASPSADEPSADASPDRPGSGPQARGWLTIEEAMRWTSFSRQYLTEKMNTGRLWFQKYGGHGNSRIRIPKAHLDEQMAKGFPLLDLPEGDIVRFLMEAPPLSRLIPAPLAPRKKITKLV